MQRRRYSYPLVPGRNDDVLYVSYEKAKGRITDFSIQYEALIDGKMHEIMRFDTAYGYAHRHTFHQSSDQTIINLTMPGEALNTAFTESLEYIKSKYADIKENYRNT